jgi:hypothetical protein
VRKTLLSTKNTHIGPAKLRDDKSRCVRTLSRLSTAFEVYWKEKKKIKGKKNLFGLQPPRSNISKSSTERATPGFSEKIMIFYRKLS